MIEPQRVPTPGLTAFVRVRADIVVVYFSPSRTTLGY
jgi:hypothetical protein